MTVVDVRVQCRDCGKVFMIHVQGLLVPLVDGSFCASNVDEVQKCECGCEAFDIVNFE
jgi:hypothetical protein